MATLFFEPFDASHRWLSAGLSRGRLGGSRGLGTMPTRTVVGFPGGQVIRAKILRQQEPHGGIRGEH
jgi:hypothetical protein